MPETDFGSVAITFSILAFFLSSICMRWYLQIRLWKLRATTRWSRFSRRTQGFLIFWQFFCGLVLMIGTITSVPAALSGGIWWWYTAAFCSGVFAGNAYHWFRHWLAREGAY